MGALMVILGHSLISTPSLAQPAASDGTSDEAERRTVEEMQRRGLAVPSPQERRRLIEGFFPSVERASIESTPLNLEIGGVSLVIPANYVSNVEQDASSTTVAIMLHVLLPDMVGVTHANRGCVQHFAKCGNYIRLTITVPRSIVARDMLENVLRLRSQAERIPWANGQEIIRIGGPPDGSGIVYYWAEDLANDQTLLARCITLAGGVPSACIAAENKINGIAFSYVFAGKHIERLVQLDGQVRALVHRFLQ